jgi:RHS repeat-associated protein
MQAPGAGPGGGDLDAVYTYDANGNVGQLVAWAPELTTPPGEWSAARLVAHYEYDPYGGVTAQSGSYAAANPVRFSTKYWDDETGLGYWGYRYYNPALGRWISRDPLGEHDDVGLYRYVKNSATTAVDPFGLFWEWFPRAWEGSCCPQCRPGDTLYAGVTVYSFVRPDSAQIIRTTTGTLSGIGAGMTMAERNPAACCCAAITAVAGDPYTSAALGYLGLAEKSTPQYIWIRIHCLRCTHTRCGWLGFSSTYRWSDASPGDWIRCPGGTHIGESVQAEWECQRWAEDKYCR